MSGKTVAGIVLILAVVNLFALMWYQIVFLEAVWVLFSVVITVLIIAFSASAFSEKKNDTN